MLLHSCHQPIWSATVKPMPACTKAFRRRQAKASVGHPPVSEIRRSLVNPWLPESHPSDVFYMAKSIVSCVVGEFRIAFVSLLLFIYQPPKPFRTKKFLFSLLRPGARSVSRPHTIPPTWLWKSKGRSLRKRLAQMFYSSLSKLNIDLQPLVHEDMRSNFLTIPEVGHEGAWSEYRPPTCPESDEVFRAKWYGC